jgi:hypothetical protein
MEGYLSSLLSWLELPGTDVGRVDWGAATGSWLGADLWEATTLLREAGGRVAQERLSPALVADQLATLR